MEPHGELLRIFQGFCPLYVSVVAYGRRIPCPSMASVILQLPLSAHVISLKSVVAKMIIQNWRDSSLSMADRGCTPVFQDFTQGRCRFIEWQWHCAVERCHLEAEHLS